VLLAKQTANVHNKIHVLLACQDILMMPFFKIACSAQQQPMQSILDASSAAIKFKVLPLYAPLVPQELMSFKLEDNV
jgi:hypothetical protein